MSTNLFSGVRAGRLAGRARASSCSTACATTSTSTRPASPTRRSPQTQFVQHRHEQLRPARRPRLGARRQRGAARQHRPDVRPADPRRLRAGAAALRARRRRRSTRSTAPATPAARRRVRRRSPNPVPTGTLAQQSPWAVDPDFEVARTWQSNAQVEQAFGNDFTTSVGVMYAKGWNLPVVTDINLINPVGSLADGRPIFARRRERQHARRSALQPHLPKCSRSASRPSSRCRCRRPSASAPG